jgi:hypothetical protein
VVRVKDGQAELMYIHDPARYNVRTLSAQEWRGLDDWLKENRANDLGPLNLAAVDGMQYEYLHLDREGGRRFMNNPGIWDQAAQRTIWCAINYGHWSSRHP